MGDKVIAVVATLDTKGNEVKYLKERIESKGYRALVVDGGVLGSRRLLRPMSPGRKWRRPRRATSRP